MNQRLLRFLLICFLLSGSPLLAYDMPRWEWKPIWPINGGLNIVDNKEQLPIGQLLSCDNFLWRQNQLVGREGFQKYVTPSTSGSINFLSLFKKSTGESYLIYSDGKGLWSLTLSNRLRTELVTGSNNKGTVTIATGTKVLHGNTVADEKWRTVLGTSEEKPITIGSRTGIIAKIILDTLLLLKTDLDTGYIAGTYNINMPVGSINAALQSNDVLRIYGSAGTKVFTNPTSYTKPDSLWVNRYHLAAPYIKRHQWSSTIPSLMFKTNDSLSATYSTGANFLRLTTDPKRNVAGNPLPTGHHFYMSYPILGAYATPDSFYVGAAAFMPDSVGSGAAEYFVAEKLVYDASSRKNIMVDSVRKHWQDTSGWIGSPAAYEKIWLDSMPDTLEYATGDWFMSPSRGSRSVGSLTSQVYDTASKTLYYNFINIDTLRSFAGKTPAITSMRVSQSGSDLVLYGIYNAKTRKKVRTDYLWLYGPTVSPTITFNPPIYLNVADSYYVAAVLSSSPSSAAKRIGRTTNTYGNYPRMWKIYSTQYASSIPDSLIDPTGTIEGYWLSAELNLSLFDSTVVANTTPLTCYPVAGGYVTADSAIYTASPDSLGFRCDSCYISLFRQKREVQATITAKGVDNVALYQLSTFEVRSTEPDRVYWSEVSDPDSFVVGNFMVLEFGNPIIRMGEQLGSLIAYTKTNRWKIFPFGEGSFATEKLNGSRGCVARNSFLNIDNVHYGLSSDGYWECGGDVPVLISDAISTYFTDSINTESYQMVAAGYDQINDDIWLSIPTGNSTVNNVTLVFHRPTKSWWRQSFNAGAYTYNSDRSVCDSAGLFVGGVDSNTIYIKRGVLDDGNQITSSLQTGFYDFRLPDKAKVAKSLLLNYDSPSNNTVTLGLRRMSLGSDTEFTYSEFGSNSYWSQKIVNVVQGMTWGRHFSFSVNVNNASGFKIGDYQVLITSDRKIKQ